MMQSLSLMNLLRVGGTQGGTLIQTYHNTNIICTKQQSNLFTSILRLNWDCKACPLRFPGPWRYARSEIDTDISHYIYLTTSLCDCLVLNLSFGNMLLWFVKLQRYIMPMMDTKSCIHFLTLYCWVSFRTQSWLSKIKLWCFL